MYKALFSAGALLAALCAPAAVSAADLIDASSPQRILAIAQTFGPAELEKDSSGDPLISGKMDATKYGIWFFGCDKTKHTGCTEMQFSAGWSVSKKPSLAKINEWNRSKRFGRAYLDSDNDPRVEMDINLNKGVSADNLKDSFDWWKTVMSVFASTMADNN